jgi:hypothetical protein
MNARDSRTTRLAIPKEASKLLDIWRAAAPPGSLPLLAEFAPFQVPPALLPFVMVFRRVAPERFDYGVVGEELGFLFKENPRGKPALECANSEERNERFTAAVRSLEECRPFWFSGRLLFESYHIEFGRLCLPMRAREHQSLLIVYFPDPPLPNPRPIGPVSMDGTTRIEWLDVTTAAERA